MIHELGPSERVWTPVAIWNNLERVKYWPVNNSMSIAKCMTPSKFDWFIHAI